MVTAEDMKSRALQMRNFVLLKDCFSRLNRG